MAKIPKSRLKTLYQTSEIAEIWNSSQNQAVIEHPEHGCISPNKYREMYKGKPCPYCGQKMVHDQKFYSTSSQKKAIQLGYEYIDKWGKKTINQVGGRFFHPNYVTLDHKLNKARFPEKMFDYSNLEIICWRCNHDKGDDNTCNLKHNIEYLQSLASETLKRYPTL